MLRKIFYIHSLFSLLVEFQRGCHQCQIVKTDKDPELPYQVQIRTDYKPFEEIHIDIKHMPPGIEGFNFIFIVIYMMEPYQIEKFNRNES
jgi:hypothetical protein